MLEDTGFKRPNRAKKLPNLISFVSVYSTHTIVLVKYNFLIIRMYSSLRSTLIFVISLDNFFDDLRIFSFTFKANRPLLGLGSYLEANCQSFFAFI